MAVLGALGAALVLVLAVATVTEEWFARLAESSHIRKLEEGTEEEGREAAEILARMRSTRAVPALVRKLSKKLAVADDEIWVYEDHIARALVRIGSGAVAGLLGALGETTGERRAAVIWVLGEIGGAARPAVPALAAIAEDPGGEEGPREMAIAALRKIGEQ
jgi:hypothetical protein